MTFRLCTKPRVRKTIRFGWDCFRPINPAKTLYLQFVCKMNGYVTILHYYHQSLIHAISSFAMSL